MFPPQQPAAPQQQQGPAPQPPQQPPQQLPQQPQQQPPLMAQPAPPAERKYRPFYADPANDPHEGNYGDLLTGYYVPVNNQGVVAPNVLANNTYGAVENGVPAQFLVHG